VLRIHDPREFRWTSRSLVGYRRDKSDLDLGHLAKDVASKLRSSANVIKSCKAAVDRHSAVSEQELRSKKVDQLERQFIFSLADDFSRYQNLLAFAAHVRDSMRERDDDLSSNFLRKLEYLILELGEKFELDALESAFDALTA
jgi:hypothetical protein